MSASKVERIEGPTLVLRGEDVDTDRIIPARFLKAITFDGLEAHVFEDDRAEAVRNGHVHPFDEPARQHAQVLLVGPNFGCGSSREHAPQAIFRRGIRAIVGTSFAEIFFGNSVAIGLACVTVTPDALAELMAVADANATLACRVDLRALTVSLGSVEVNATMPAAARAGLLDGSWDVTSLLLDDYAKVEAVAARLPYAGNFATTR